LQVVWGAGGQLNRVRGPSCGGSVAASGLEWVDLVDPAGGYRRGEAADIGFGYKTSSLAELDGAVAAAGAR
jgi:UDP-N-acetylenolpyruvoylglucosamine reductase